MWGRLRGMLTTFFIAFREFLEAFLIIGVFLGLSKKLKIKKEKEIFIAAFIGILFNLILNLLTFTLGSKAGVILNEKNSEILEGYLYFFSGFFLAYVVVYLHQLFHRNQSKDILLSHEKIKKNIFDFSLFLTIFFLVAREGFEIALFSATTSLFSKFIENLIGLMAGFLLSLSLSFLVFLGLLKFSLRKIFKTTEFFIVLLGGVFVKNGIKELVEIYFDVNLSKIIPLNLSFLPSKETFFGHFFNSFFGLEKNFSFVYLLVIFFYFFVVFKLLFKR